jgi:hypothetical protein
MSVVPLSLDPDLEPRALLNCVLRDGDVIGTDDAGRTALLLPIDPWTLDRLLAFDADAADLEDADGEPEPDDEIDGPAMVLDFVPPKRLDRKLRIAQALGSPCCSRRCRWIRATPIRHRSWRRSPCRPRRRRRSAAGSAARDSLAATAVSARPSSAGRSRGARGRLPADLDIADLFRRFLLGHENITRTIGFGISRRRDLPRRLLTSMSFPPGAARVTGQLARGGGAVGHLAVQCPL